MVPLAKGAENSRTGEEASISRVCSDHLERTAPSGNQFRGA